jgi:acyl-CoA synthetase (AMP-forming)/AMP-acid ligase II
MTDLATTSLSGIAGDTGGKLVGILPRPASDPCFRPRIIDGDHEYTLRQVRNEVAHCLIELRRHGLKQGDRVLALLDHDPQAAFFLAAASSLGLRLMMPYGLHTAALPEWLSIVASACSPLPGAVSGVKAADGISKTTRLGDQLQQDQSVVCR